MTATEEGDSPVFVPQTGSEFVASEPFHPKLPFVFVA